MRRPSTATLIRLAFIAALWIALVLLILSSARLNFFTLFAIAASGVVVFVPLYKKHFRNNDK